jgi:hypothetical protein
MPPPKDLVRYKEVRRADLRNDQKTAATILNADAASVTQEQFQEFVLSQIKRIIHGDHAGTWKDDFLSLGILDLEDLTRGQLFPADCLATDSPGACVRITGPYVLGVAQVATCDISVSGGYPAVGVIQYKTSPTRCFVRTIGPLAGYITLTPGRTYFVGFDGFPALAPLDPSPSPFAAVQAIGTAIDATTLQLAVSPVRFIRAL